ncbi:hypothetical protein D3C71_1753810 [compost metagenome]
MVASDMGYFSGGGRFLDRTPVCEVDDAGGIYDELGALRLRQLHGQGAGDARRGDLANLWIGVATLADIEIPGAVQPYFARSAER